MDKFVWEIVNGLFLHNPLFWVFILAALLGAIFYKQIIGFMGEFWVRQALRKLNTKDYLVLNDIMFEGDGKTHQIDHVVVSKYGIFVIETKQYNGYVTGSEYDNNWRLQAGKKVIYINNPMRQNYGHVVELSKKLGLDMDKFIPIVCIPSTAKVKVKSKIPVARSYDLDSIIMEYKDESVLEYNKIYEEIKQFNITDRKVKRNHIVTTKEIINIKKEAMINKCPLCGGDLVLRKGSRGEFFGCSNYPKCRYTKNKN